MNALPKSSWLLTVEEYLAFEERGDVRHEYVGGEIFAMAGASRRHARIVMNISGYLWSQLRGGPCETLSNDVKLQVAPDKIYYPDVMVSCDEADLDPLIVRHPIFVAEVLSPTTATTDRREKMVEYRQLPTMLCYLVVYQDERRVERHWRDEVDDPWEFDPVIDSEVKIPGLDVRLTLDEVYEDVTFDTAE